MADCSRCDEKWDSISYAHCAGSCHETFLNVRAFDDHRVNGKCWGESSVREKEARWRALEKRDGVWGTPEGHEYRAVLSVRFAESRRKK